MVSTQGRITLNVGPADRQIPDCLIARCKILEESLAIGVNVRYNTHVCAYGAEVIYRKCCDNMQTVQECPRTDCEVAAEKVYVPVKEKPVYDICKRIFDLVMASLALIVLSPVFLVVAIAIKLEDGGDVFFIQTRMTKGCKEFRMLKFRSMCPDAEKKLDALMERNEMTGPAFKIADDPRVTKVGRFIRKTSIDELPQLLNIIAGDMSIIGPRPPLPREVEQYTPYQLHRLDVKTGLSCYHECQGRSDIHDFDEWVEADLRYIRERSMLTDIKVILWTVKVVLTGKGAM